MRPDRIPDPVAAQADAVLRVLERAIPDGQLLGVSLYGSAVSGGLRPDSDLDLFAVISHPLTDAQKRALVEGLVPLSWRRIRPTGWRPLELTIVVQGDVRPWRYPPRFDFQYGEWLRDTLVAGVASGDPGWNWPIQRADRVRERRRGPLPPASGRSRLCGPPNPPPHGSALTT